MSLPVAPPGPPPGAAAPAGARGRFPAGRRGLAADVPFPVTPMLDMAFQLLAFFLLTYRPPSSETRLDLYLPAAPAALPAPAPDAPRTRPPAPDADRAWVVRATADPRGGLRALTLDGVPVAGPMALRAVLDATAGARRAPRPARLVADEALRYEVAARIIAALESAGIASIQLAGPEADAP